MLFQWSLFFAYIPKMIGYIPVTLKIAAISAIFGIIFGLVLALIRIYQIPLLDQLVKILISFLRATPPNILLLLIFFAIPYLLQDAFMTLFKINVNRMDLIYYVLIAYSIMNAAFFAEMFRASILGVDKGQAEAAYSIGMNRRKAFVRIIFPQAFRIALPELCNILINIVKNTSLAFMVGVIDLMGSVSLVSAKTFHPFEGYVVAALFYLIISLILEYVFGRLSDKYKSFE